MNTLSSARACQQTRRKDILNWLDYPFIQLDGGVP